MKIKIALLLLALCTFWGVRAQTVKINNNMTVESDGTIVVDGDATTWDDLMVYPDATSRSGSNAPTWSSTKFASNGTSQGVYMWMFDDGTEQEVYFTIQIPHSYKLGSTIKPHVHWTTISGTPTGNVVWGLEYTMMKIGGNFSSTSTILTSYSTIPATPSGTRQHIITGLGDIVSGTSPNDIDVSTILVCRLFRQTGNGIDIFPNPVGFLGFDIHYEKNTDGSHTEYQK